MSQPTCHRGCHLPQSVSQGSTPQEDIVVPGFTLLLLSSPERVDLLLKAHSKLSRAEAPRDDPPWTVTGLPTKLLGTPAAKCKMRSSSHPRPRCVPRSCDMPGSCLAPKAAQRARPSLHSPCLGLNPGFSLSASGLWACDAAPGGLRVLICEMRILAGGREDEALHKRQRLCPPSPPRPHIIFLDLGQISGTTPLVLPQGWSLPWGTLQREATKGESL